MILAESSSESSNSIGVAVGFAFRLAEGFAAASRGSLEAGDTLLGIGMAGSDGGPCDEGKIPKAEARCQNKLQSGEAWLSPWLNSS